MAHLLTPPRADARSASRLGRWITSLVERGVLPVDAGYPQLWAWSVAEPEAFWPALADEVGLRWATAPQRVLERGAGVEGARWFAGAAANYATWALRPAGVDDDDLAVLARSEARPDRRLTFAELRAEVGRIAAGLAAEGVGHGDTVAGYLPNVAEAVVCLLAAASIGARFTSCAPEMGAAGVLDRLGQVEPVVLVAVDGYRYGGRAHDRSEEVAAISAGLPSLRRVVWLRHLGEAAPHGSTDYEAFGAGLAVRGPTPLAADTPLHVLYSSGTTGKPKALVHGHAGIGLEHAKALAMHFDLGAGDRFCWYTTTGWMMWNFLVSGLLVGATVVCFDGAPTDLFGLFADVGATVAGVGAAALVAAERAGRRPADEVDLSALRVLGSTGSPLPASTAAWAAAAIPGAALGSFSGGTDVCTGFVGPSPLHGVWAGEMSCRCLGAAVAVVDATGSEVVDEEGELVLTEPLPSMPLAFVGDADGSRLHAAYFAQFPGLWAHGDRATLTSRGTVVITGRSDGTLNRGGVRMGTAEFYGVVESLPGVDDSLAVHLEDDDQLWLLVVAPGAPDDLEDRIRSALRHQLSPRHVPDRIARIRVVPRTLSGKKLEVPVKRLLAGGELHDVVALASVADPSAFDDVLALRER